MRNFSAKRAWVRQHAGDSISDAALVSLYASHFKVRDEEKAGSEIADILEADGAVEKDFGAHAHARHIALGQKLLRDCVSAGQMGAAAQIWKSLCTFAGMDAPQHVEVQISAPAPEIVRARVAELLRKKSVRDAAAEAQLEGELAQLAERAGYADEASEVRDEPTSEESDPMSPMGNVLRRAESAEPNEHHSPNPLAEHVAARLPE